MTCPICKKPGDPRFRPFCSVRCADIDLGKWMSGSYAVASHDPEDVEKALEAIEKSEAGKDKLH